MQLKTHIAIGLTLGMLIRYLLNLNPLFVLLVAFSGFFPDMDWVVMELGWKLGNKHRTFLHNVWSMLGVSAACYSLFPSLANFFGVIVGYASHMIGDSMTSVGVCWAWPWKRLFFKGRMEMFDEKEMRRELLLQLVLYGLSAIVFALNPFPLVPYFAIGIAVLVGLTATEYALMKEFNKAVAGIFRKLRWWQF